MCQYSSVDGEANDWHFTHINSLALSGAAPAPLVPIPLAVVLPRISSNSQSSAKISAIPHSATDAPTYSGLRVRPKTPSVTSTGNDVPATMRA